MQDMLDKLTFSAKPAGTQYKNWSKCQPASGVSAGSCWPSVTDVIDEGEGDRVAARPVTAPEMTGDLLNAAFSYACALFIVNFNVLLIKESASPP